MGQKMSKIVENGQEFSKKKERIIGEKLPNVIIGQKFDQK